MRLLAVDREAPRASRASDSPAHFPIVAAAILLGSVGWLGWRAFPGEEHAVARRLPPTARVCAANGRPRSLSGPVRLAADGRVFRGAAPNTSAQCVLLDDGSGVEVASGTALRVLRNDATAVALALEPRRASVTGHATFDIQPHGPRRWSIDVGLATVVVVGTRFTLERGARYTEVRVERGHVRVQAKGSEGYRDLFAGQSVRIERPAEPEAQAVARVVPTRPETAQSDSVVAPAPRWRVLVERGEYDRAYAELDEDRFGRELRMARDVGTLLALSDAARLSGHAEQALSPLREILNRHVTDDRASIAAFTLGRTLLESLGRPAEAATYFERAIDLGLPASLEESAYVRWVESLGRSGHVTAARAAESRYAARFPTGALREEVRRWAPAL